MKALSLTQPWADIVLDFGKPVENRSWNTNFRGRFLVHASKRCTKRDYESAIDFSDKLIDDLHRGNWYLPEGKAADMICGGLMGIAELYDVVPPEQYGKSRAGVDMRWHMYENATGKRQFGFLLRNVRRLPFIPYPGALGFFNVESRKVESMALAKHSPATAQQWVDALNEAGAM